MGCFDIYCLVCGNPCHGAIYNTEYLEEIIKTKKDIIYMKLI
jgi:hypothetical protein